MALELKIVDNQDVELVVKDRVTKKIKLKLGKTLDGNLIVQNHHNIDIVIMPEKGKILAIPKNEYNDEVYTDQDQFFQSLLKSGVIIPDTIVGGNIYGSLQAKFNTKKLGEEEPLDVVLLNTYYFIQSELFDHAARKKYIDDLEKELLSPDEENSTELGEIPQEKNKGSIPRYGFPTRGIYRYNY